MEKVITRVEIRHAKVSDAEILMKLRKKLFRETQYMLLEEDEYQPSIESEADFIDLFSQSDNSTIFLVFKKQQLIAFMGVAGGTANRKRHCADIFLGVQKSAWGKGVGWQLMQALLAWSATTSLQRLALSVAVDNKKAIALYHKAGFEIEGVKKGNLMLDDIFVDEYAMSILLGRS